MTNVNGTLMGTGAGAGGDLNIQGNISASGDITAQGDVIAYRSSDERYKENIINISDPLGKLKSIGGYTYDWNDKAPSWTRSQTTGSLHDVGVIAQEIQKIIPEAIRVRTNGFLAVSYERLIPLLIEGIKDQQNTIENLELRIKKLEDK